MVSLRPCSKHNTDYTVLKGSHIFLMPTQVSRRIQGDFFKLLVLRNHQPEILKLCNSLLHKKKKSSQTLTIKKL